MKSVIEAVPVALISAFYIYIQWYLIVEVGFQRLPLIGKTIALSFFVAYVGAAWYLLGNPNGTRQNLSVWLLIAAPLAYIIGLVVASVLHIL